MNRKYLAAALAPIAVCLALSLQKKAAPPPQPVIETTLENLTRDGELILFDSVERKLEEDHGAQLILTAQERKIVPASEVIVLSQRLISRVPNTPYFQNLIGKLNADLELFAQYLPTELKTKHFVTLEQKSQSEGTPLYLIAGGQELISYQWMIKGETLIFVKTRPLPIGEATISVDIKPQEIKITQRKITVAPDPHASADIKYGVLATTVLCEYLHSLLKQTRARYIEKLFEVNQPTSAHAQAALVKVATEVDEGVTHASVYTYIGQLSFQNVLSYLNTKQATLPEYRFVREFQTAVETYRTPNGKLLDTKSRIYVLLAMYQGGELARLRKGSEGITDFIGKIIKKQK